MYMDLWTMKPLDEDIALYFNLIFRNHKIFPKESGGLLGCGLWPDIIFRARLHTYWTLVIGHIGKTLHWPSFFYELAHIYVDLIVASRSLLDNSIRPASKRSCSAFRVHYLPPCPSVTSWCDVCVHGMFS